MKRNGWILTVAIIISCFFVGCAKVDYDIKKEYLLMGDGDETPYSSVLETGIVINEVETMNIEKIFSSNMVNLSEDNYKEMSREEIIEYFGIELDISNILPDYHEDSDSRYGFYGFPDGSILDQQSFIYMTDKEQKLTITIRKNRLPINALVETYRFDMESSRILDSDVMVIHYIDINGIDIYYAEMIANNLGVTITAKGMELEELSLVLNYILM